ncbi:MAG: DEAD/DEAH box helicase [Dermatophilaceae bacterium]
MSARDPAEVLATWACGQRRESLLHVHRSAAREASTGTWPSWLAPPVAAALAAAGLGDPWVHQLLAAEELWAGRSVAMATGTASGKSLGYLMPVLSALAASERTLAGRGAGALYLAPTKALAADQLAHVAALAVPGVRPATYDGDTPRDERAWIRAHANYVLTNPDMLHHALLPAHEAWSGFWRALRFVVVDEAHVYRGVFGAHVAAVLRRLRRVCARYGTEPAFVVASATLDAPARHARDLVGVPALAVTQDGSPRPERHLAFWEPPLVRGEDGVDRRRSATAEAADLLADLVARDVQTVVFARSRAAAESVAAGARRAVGETRPDLMGRVASYRGGYLPEERRALERALRRRELLGLATTNALELGIDIGGLDAVLVAGWPGSRASLWQQVGRAGRAGRAALGVFIAAGDPLDTYLVHHPEVVVGAPIEAAVLDPHNPYVLAPHLTAAAAELPLRTEDANLFGPGTRLLLDSLVAAGALRRRPSGWYWMSARHPAADFTLRGADQPVAVVEADTGRVIGTVDGARADATVHPGAVHVHQGRTYVVTSLDLGSATALAVEGDPGWFTQARAVSAFDIRFVRRREENGPVTRSYGRVLVRRQVVSFLRRLPGGEVLGEHPLQLPERQLETTATWWTVDASSLESALAEVGLGPEDVAGALHAAEHAAIGLLPLVATADRWDVGGVSTELHPDTGRPTIMVYDGYPGGAGFAERGFAAARDWLAATRDAVDGCGCVDGCPACVQSPKCGNGNEPLSKPGAVRVLDLLLAATGDVLATTHGVPAENF